MCPIDPVDLDIITGTKRPWPWRKHPWLWRGLACLMGPTLALVNVLWYALAKGDLESSRAYTMWVVVQVAIMALATWMSMSEDDREGALGDRPRLHAIGEWGALELLMGSHREPRWVRWSRWSVALGVVLFVLVMWRHGWGVLRWW